VPPEPPLNLGAAVVECRLPGRRLDQRRKKEIGPEPAPPRVAETQHARPVPGAGASHRRARIARAQNLRCVKERDAVNQALLQERGVDLAAAFDQQRDHLLGPKFTEHPGQIEAAITNGRRSDADVTGELLHA